MEIKLKIEGADRLQQAIAKAPQAIGRRLLIGMRVVTTRIAEEARTHHRFITRSGWLEESIQDRVTVAGAEVLGRVELNPAMTMTKSGHSYGFFQHEGTQDHWVGPVNRKMLRWVGPDGKARYSKGHMVKGIRPDPFLYNAYDRLEARGELQAAFNRQIDLAFKEAGV